MRSTRIGNASDIIKLRHIPVFNVVTRKYFAVAIAHSFYVYSLVIGGRISVIRPKKGAKPHLITGSRKLLYPVCGHFHNLAGSQLAFILEAELFIRKILKGNAIAVLAFAYKHGSTSKPVASGDNISAISQYQN